MKISDITESFNTYSGQNIPRTYSGPNEFSTVTQIGDREIRFVAGRLSDEDWDIDFREMSNKSGASYGKTGSGNQMQVLSFVLESLKIFIKKYNPESIEFTSSRSDSNRTRLYKSIADKIMGPEDSLDVTPAGGVDVFRVIRNL